MVLKEKKDRIQKNIKEAGELFYQGKMSEGYLNVNKIILDLSELMDYIGNSEERKEKNMEAIQRLNEILTEAFQAMQEQDAVLLADIMKYDLYETLEELGE